jgi:hypothetical protein
MAVSPDPVRLLDGDQGVMAVTVRNLGDAADIVRVTMSGDAPVAYDTPQESQSVAPGQSVHFTIRLTPQRVGSGTLSAVATGSSGSLAKDVRVEVAAKQAADPATRIVASLDPVVLPAHVGKASVLSVRLANQGSAADTVQVEPDAGSARVSFDPAHIQVALAPGESAVRQFRVTPLQEGEAVLHVHLVSAGGLDVMPLATLEASHAAAGDGGSHDGSSSGAPAGKHKSPGLEAPAMVAALAAALAAVSRRRRA